jgi:hypothetical protein
MNEKVTPFPNDASRKALQDLLRESQPANGTPYPKIPQKLGVYPLGDDDVLVSKALFDLILFVLERGTAEGRAEIARLLRESYGAPFQL